MLSSHLFCPPSLLMLSFSLSIHTIALTAVFTNFLYYSCKTALISVQVSELQDAVFIAHHTLGEHIPTHLHGNCSVSQSQCVALPP